MISNVFSFRHLTAARIMGMNVTNLKSEDAGRALVDKLLSLMSRLNVPNGLRVSGFSFLFSLLTQQFQ
jgi:alcohol dehydrogenase class IV